MKMIGWFRDLQTAQRAARELDAYGIDRQRVRVTTASAVDASTGTGNASLLSWSGLRALLGHDHPPADAAIALVAEVDPAAADEAARILQRNGSVRVDQRGAPAGQRPAPEERVARVEARPMERVVEQPVTIREQTIDVQRQTADRPATEDDLRTWSAFEARGPIEPSSDTASSTTVPVIEERLDIEKRRRETARLRVRKSVETEERRLNDTSVEQTYDVDRVPINRVVAEAPAPRYEGDTLVLPVLEEVLVTEKKLLLREEVHIRRKREERTTAHTHTVRREQVHVDRVQPE